MESSSTPAKVSEEQTDFDMKQLNLKPTRLLDAFLEKLGFTKNTRSDNLIIGQFE